MHAGVPTLSHHRFRVLAAAAFALAIAAGTPTSSPAAAGLCGPAAHRIPTASNLAVAGAATLCLLNHQRALHGLPALRVRPSLAAASSRYAHQMVAEHFFGHVSPSGSTVRARVASSGYLRGASSWSAGENVAWGAGAAATPASIVRAWMHSAGHRANILAPRFRDLGVGIAPGAPAAVGRLAAATYATEFGSRN